MEFEERKEIANKIANHIKDIILGNPIWVGDIGNFCIPDKDGELEITLVIEEDNSVNFYANPEHSDLYVLLVRMTNREKGNGGLMHPIPSIFWDFYPITLHTKEKNNPNREKGSSGRILSS